MNLVQTKETIKHEKVNQKQKVLVLNNMVYKNKSNLKIYNYIITHHSNRWKNFLIKI